MTTTAHLLRPMELTRAVVKLTAANLTAWAGTKRDCGVKRRKQFGLLTL
jgi:hypothetical protein